jgi:hypothetical protein
MKIQLTKQECRQLATLVREDKLKNIGYNLRVPNRVFKHRIENMAILENKLNRAIWASKAIVEVD